jgi:hypothetical protein
MATDMLYRKGYFKYQWVSVCFRLILEYYSEEKYVIAPSANIRESIIKGFTFVGLGLSGCK